MTDAAPDRDRSELARQDRDHHIQPFTDPRILIEEGGPTVIVRGEGCTLWDEDGRAYLDALAGLWCVNVGYGRAELAEVAAEQMRRLAYYNTFFKTTSPPTAALAARLAALMPAGLDRVLFANSGSEAVHSIVDRTIVVSGKKMAGRVVYGGRRNN